MTTKRYDILLDNKKIGISKLEKADAPMGVVCGKLTFNENVSAYDFLKAYCLNNCIKIITDYPEDKLIVTGDIPNLKVINPNGVEIKGQVTNVEGMDSDFFEVIIIGVSYPFFEDEFPHHVKAYRDQFKD